jgi:cytochrome b561
MRIRNSTSGYGLVAILLHWGMAALVIGLFLLGLYMTGLDYYHPWYRSAPDLHRGLGVVTALLLIVRVAWRSADVRPGPEPGTPRHLARAAEWVHRTLYLLVLLIVVSGYLISTADGRGIDVFGVFELPALVSGIDNMEDVAGEIHFALAVGLMGLVALHAAAALKHHFLDGNGTLKRMLVPGTVDNHSTNKETE